MRPGCSPPLHFAATHQLSRERWVFVEYLALSGVAFAQPLLDTLGRNANYLVTSGVTVARAIMLIILVCIVPPCVMWACERLSGYAGHRVRFATHQLITCAILIVLFVQVIRRSTSLGANEVIAGAIALGIASTWTLHNWKLSRQFLRYLAWTPLLAAVLFLRFSPATDAIFSKSQPGIKGVRVGAPHRVVFIVLDEMPTRSLLDGKGHVDQQLFPNFAKLEQQSTWYRNSTTVAGYTQGAVPALLTGRTPRSLKTLSTSSEHPGNLFALLENSYSLKVHEAVTRLCPSASCTSFKGAGLSGLLRTSTDLWRTSASPKKRPKISADFDDANASAFALDNATDFVNSINGSAPNHLDFLHVLLPHYPWHYVNTLQGHRATSHSLPGEKYLSPWSPTGAQTARQRHLLQVQATDTLLGQIVERLEDLEAFDDTMLIVTADHGISFSATEPARNVTNTNSADLMWTPLFVKYPNQSAGVIDDRSALSIDVFPTILDVLKIDVPSTVPGADGISLRATARATNERFMYPATGLTDAQANTEFTKLLQSRAVAPNLDAELRIYRDSQLGALIGTRMPTAYRSRDVVTTGAKVNIDNRKAFRSVDRDARNAEWLWSLAEFTNVTAGATAVFTVNDTIAATCTTVRDPGNDVRCSFTVPPSLVADGDNEIAMYLVDDPIRLRFTKIAVT